MFNDTYLLCSALIGGTRADYTAQTRSDGQARVIHTTHCLLSCSFSVSPLETLHSLCTEPLVTFLSCAFRISNPALRAASINAWRVYLPVCRPAIRWIRASDVFLSNVHNASINSGCRSEFHRVSQATITSKSSRVRLESSAPQA